MYYLYMDSGTSTTRAYLIRDMQPVDSCREKVGTKDSAVSGSNDVLLAGMRRCCDTLLERNGLRMADIETVWASGMVTNTFGVVEVEHCSTPVDARALMTSAWRHREEKHFHRDLMLIRGAKTCQPGQTVDLGNIMEMNNVRGEEIEAAGLVAMGILPSDRDCVMLSPGSHTHAMHLSGGRITDILSSFTGEVNHAIRQDTILGGELSAGAVKMEPSHVLQGWKNLRSYGFTRSMYIIHATRVFDVCSDEVRSQLLEGVIAGSTVDVLCSRIRESWTGVKKIVIIGGKPYMEAYEILCRHLMPEMDVVLYNGDGETSPALHGFLEILRLSREKGN